jgi:beta-mannosidase
MNRRTFLESSLLGSATSALLRSASIPVTSGPVGEPISWREALLSGDDWRLGAFPFGEGETRKAFLPEFDDSNFKTVQVPGEVQIQIGLEGMDRYCQSKELSLINENEWWYRKKFDVSREAAGKLNRLVFDGVDYFSTVWLNGKKLGDHEGCFVPFSFDVSKELRYGAENTLALKVTCPWVPKNRGFLEYMKGEWTMSDPSNVVRFSFPPYILGPYWDGIPAAGNAAFPMGLWRDVKLIASRHFVVENAFVITRAINSDGSAKLDISGKIKNYASHDLSISLQLKIEPDNFTGRPLILPRQSLIVHPGESSFRAEADVKGARLWWTWDSGAQNLYKLTATLSDMSDGVAETFKTVFGIRIIRRESNMSYWLNGRRLFLKGAWYPMSNYYGSLATRETYEKDLRLYRAANLNHIVAFCYVEKADFYDLCDRLGILVIFEYPFSQFGPEEVLACSSPRREIFVKESLDQLRQITIELRNHPSIIEWAAFAEAHQKGGSWGVDDLDLEKYGYGKYSDAIGKLVEELDHGTIYQPSLCDLGEQHFWMANAGMGTQGGYNQHFYANAGFVSEYGSIAPPCLESLKKMLTSEEMWSNNHRLLPEWSNLPIDVSAYAYQSSFEYNGFASMLRRVDQYVDRYINSVQELVDDCQLYQAFLLKYATEAYRRKKYNSINGTRFWAFGEVTPGIRFNVVDYYRVPKMSYYFVKRSQDRFAINFAYEEALESQVSGKRLHIPVWLINDYRREVLVDLRCGICDLHGRVIWSKEFSAQIESDEAREVGIVDWVTPDHPGIYVLHAQAFEREGPLTAREYTFIKVTPKLFSRSVRILLIGERKYSVPIAAMAEAMGVKVDTIKEEHFPELTQLRNPEQIKQQYDIVWLTSFDSLWKLLDAKIAAGLTEAIREGVGFIHTGGPGSFHGGFGRAACLDFSRLAEVLPVALKGRNDLVLGPVYRPSADIAQHFSLLKNIQVSSDCSTEWNDCEFSKYGLPGFNEVKLRPGSREVLRISGKPLLITGRFGAGRTVAFTGFTPVYAEERAYWNDKIVFPYLLDHLLYEEPATQSYFLLFMRMIAAAIGEQPSTNYDVLLEARNKPHFEMLKDLRPAQVSLPHTVRAKIDGEGLAIPVEVRNGPVYARLVRLRMEWDEPKHHAPYLEMYSDNYFDLLPGVSRTITVDVLFPKGQPRKATGTLFVEGVNLAAQQVPLEIDPI